MCILTPKTLNTESKTEKDKIIYPCLPNRIETKRSLSYCPETLQLHRSRSGICKPGA